MKIPNRLRSPNLVSIRTLRPIPAVLAAFCFLLLASCSQSNAPEWQVVNYWATWCGPCRDEIPELNELAKLNPQKLEVLGVNYDAPKEPEASKHIEEMGIEFANISIPSAEAMGLSTPSTLPTTYILRNGEIQKMLRGPQTLESLVAATDLADKQL